MGHQIQNIFTSSLFLNPNRPTYTAFHEKNWGNGPHIRGLYSSPTIYSSQKYKEILEEPIYETMYFAGEHVNKNTCATVQSAIDSGVEAAVTLLENTDNPLNNFNN